jgi:hypothetical protein
MDNYTRRNENFTYAYDPAGNLTNRNNGDLSQAFSVDPANQLTSISRNASLTYAGGLTNLPISLTINGVGADIYSNMTFATQWGGIPLNDGNNSFTNVLQTGPAAWVTNILTRNLPASVKIELNEPTNAASVPAKNDLALEQLLRCEPFSKRRKAHVHQTEHPNALPASWRCPG